MDGDTLQFYRRNVEAHAGWAKAPSARLVFSRHAAGNHSKEMLARGFSVRATDGSPEMAAIALQRLHHTAEATLFHELDARAAYDGAWASACLFAGGLARRRRGSMDSGQIGHQRDQEL